VEDGDTPNEKLERDLRNFVTASGLPGSAMTVSITYAEGDNEGDDFDLSDENNELQKVEIVASLPYSQISLFPNRYMGGKNVTARLVMRSGFGGGISN
ncbi:MAG: hypothetical protein RIK87_15850, partial [Fuerstiella sp.]